MITERIPRASEDFAAATRTAIEYEVKMRDLYLEAAGVAKDDTRRTIFRKLAADEANHMEYLKKHLGEWLESGRITAERLRSALPDRLEIHAVSLRVGRHLAPNEFENEQVILQKALAAETESLVFFRRLVESLPHEGQKQLFHNLMLAEENHLAIVKAELDYVILGTSTWVNAGETPEDPGR